MTDSAAAGSVQGEAVAPAAGNPPGAAPPPENGSAGAGKDWVNGLSEGNRKLVETKGWTADDGLEKALTSYSELERKVGSSLNPPADDAPEEERLKVYDRLGRPKEPKYEFKRPENYPADLPYDAELATGIQPVLHSAGLNGWQAQKVHDGFLAHAAARQKAMQQQVADAITSTHDTLVKDWGPKGGERFMAEVEFANKSLKKLGLMDAYKRAGLVMPDGTLTDPAIAKAHAALGRTYFREDTIDAGKGGVSGRNPFKDETKNITEQSRLKKTDPELARRMIKDAGKDPAAFGL